MRMLTAMTSSGPMTRPRLLPLADSAAPGSYIGAAVLNRRALETDEAARVLDLAQMAIAVRQTHTAERLHERHLANRLDRHPLIGGRGVEAAEVIVGRGPYLAHIGAKVRQRRDAKAGGV